MSKITIAVPTYNRQDYLRDSLNSILSQSFQDFNIIIFDNHSDYDIESFIAGFKDARISLVRSEKNIGNATNFQKVFDYKYDSEYLVVFHDDDAMHPSLLESEIKILENDPRVVLVGTGLNFVEAGQPILKFTNLRTRRNISVFEDAADLVRLILKDFDLSFDSVMYRVKFIEGISRYQEQFFKWADRPFLVNIAKKGSVAIIKDKLINYRIHGGQDSQSSAAEERDCLFNLFTFYRDTLPQPLSWRDRRLFYYFSANQLILSGLGFSRNFQEYGEFIRTSRRTGLFFYRYLNLRGLYYFFKVLKKLL